MSGAAPRSLDSFLAGGPLPAPPPRALEALPDEDHPLGDLPPLAPPRRARLADLGSPETPLPEQGDRLDPSVPENPRWSFAEQLAAVGGAQSATDEAGAEAEADPLRAEDPSYRDPFYGSLKALRNYYMLSRLTELQHHFDVRFSAGEGEEHTHLRYAGVDLASLRRMPTLVRGPCCAWATAPLSDSPGTRRHRETPDVQAMKSRVAGLAREHAGAAAGEPAVEYYGRVQSVTVTELLVLTEAGASARDDLRDELQGQLSTMESMSRGAVSELDRLDLECMLSCLGSPAAPAATPAPTSEPEEQAPGHRAVKVAHLTLVMDAEERVLNRSFADKANVRTELTCLGELRPRADSYWVEYSPTHPGSVELLRGAEALQPLLAAVRASVASVRDNSYSSPLSLLEFVQGDGVLPAGYRQRGALSVRLGAHEVAELPIDVHAAVFAAPATAEYQSLRHGLVLELRATLIGDQRLELRARSAEGGGWVSAGASFSARLHMSTTESAAAVLSTTAVPRMLRLAVGGVEVESAGLEFNL